MDWPPPHAELTYHPPGLGVVVTLKPESMSRYGGPLKVKVIDGWVETPFRAIGAREWEAGYEKVLGGCKESGNRRTKKKKKKKKKKIGTYPWPPSVG